MLNPICPAFLPHVPVLCTTMRKPRTTNKLVCNTPSPRPARKRAPLSAESRAKISAALKGRRKSEEHRASLRRRFKGESNPMYGRTLSAESRAKISAALLGKKRACVPEEKKKPTDLRALEGLREKARDSKLLARGDGKVLSLERRRKKEKEGEKLESVLKRVASLQAPPDWVAKKVREKEKERDGVSVKTKGRKKKVNVSNEKKTCEMCVGSGVVSCAECVGAFGVASARCESCFGVGKTFCQTCQGVGLR